MNNLESKSINTPNQTEYLIYEHPVLKRQIVKRGFSWPAMIIGPAWLLFRKLWSDTILFLIFSVICYAILSSVYGEVDIFLFGEKYGDYNDTDPVWMPEDRLKRLEYAKLVLIFSLQFLVARIGNTRWEKNLVNRGYELKETIQARSRDEVTAILARKNLKEGQ